MIIPKTLFFAKACILDPRFRGRFIVMDFKIDMINELQEELGDLGTENVVVPTVARKISSICSSYDAEVP